VPERADRFRRLASQEIGNDRHRGGAGFHDLAGAFEGNPTDRHDRLLS